MSTITSFVEGFTTSGMMKWYAAVLDCGHWHYHSGWKPFPVEVTVGSGMDCDKCAEVREAEARLEVLDLSEVAYLRFSSRWAYPDQGIFGQYHAYRRDSSSPTGVKLLCSFPATKEIDAIIDRRRLCTLSPTEGR
jgi:hypothetical protein